MVEVHLVDVGVAQGVALQVQRLGAVGLRDAGVADQHVSQTVVWDMRALAPSSARQPADNGRPCFRFRSTKRTCCATYTLSDEDLQRPECDETSSKAERVGQGG